MNPLRPENRPDRWERACLLSFEAGARESASVEKFNGQRCFRLMRPLVTEKSCLACHAAQGYKVGMTRGGISVTIPMTPFDGALVDTCVRLVLGHMILWCAGIVGIGLFGRSFSHNINEEFLVQRELRESNKFLESVVGAHQDGMVILARDLSILRLNDKIKSLFPEALAVPGRKCHMLFHGTDKPCSGCPALRAMSTGKTQVAERGMPAAGAYKRWLEVTAHPMRDENDVVIGVVEYLRDITERKSGEMVRAAELKNLQSSSRQRFI